MEYTREEHIKVCQRLSTLFGDMARLEQAGLDTRAIMEDLNWLLLKEAALRTKKG